MDSSEEIFGKLLILVITAIIAAVVSHLLVRACRRGMERTGKPTTSLPFNIIRGVVWFLAALIVLKPVFGIDPTAFVAALGVTSIIISFGMQTTISNLVGGIELITSRTLEVGDVVDVNGTRGVVTDITWRNTLVREFTGNVEIIPNSQLDSATIVRLSPQMANLVTFTLMATSDADPAQVSAEVMAAIRAAAASELAEGYEPSVVCRGSGDCGGLAFQASLHLADPTHEYAVVDAIMDELGGRQWLLGASR